MGRRRADEAEEDESPGAPWTPETALAVAFFKQLRYDLTHSGPRQSDAEAFVGDERALGFWADILGLDPQRLRAQFAVPLVHQGG